MFFDSKNSVITFKGLIDEFIGTYELNLILTDSLYAKKENKIKVSIVRK